MLPEVEARLPAELSVYPEGTQQVAAVSSVSPAAPFQNVPPTVSQTPVIAATPVPTITANITSVPVPPAAAPPPPTTPIVPVVPPTPPVVKVSIPKAGGPSGEVGRSMPHKVPELDRIGVPGVLLMFGEALCADEETEARGWLEVTQLVRAGLDSSPSFCGLVAVTFTARQSGWGRHAAAWRAGEDPGEKGVVAVVRACGPSLPLPPEPPVGLLWSGYPASVGPAEPLESPTCLWRDTHAYYLLQFDPHSHPLGQTVVPL